MNHLSFIEKLLDGVEVEWKPLGETCEVGDGNHSSKYPRSDEMVDQGVPFIRGTNMVNGTVSVQDMKFITQEKHQELRKGHLKAYDVLIANRGEIGKIAQVPKQFAGSNLNSQLAWLRADQEILLPRYLFYVLNTSHVQGGISGEGGALQQLTIKNIKLIEIPIPCPENPKKSLEIQAEIVRILDAFTAHTAELTAELTARKKQYNYYRDKLLSFEEGDVEWKTLGEVAEYSKTRISFEKLDESNYVGVDNLLQNRAGKSDSNYVPTSGNLTRYSQNDILIGNIRPYLKKIWQADCAGGTNGDVLVLHPTDSEVNARYLYQVLADDKFFEYNMQHAKGAKMPRGNKEKIMEYPLPIPPIEEQARIVAILDKFDALTNSISEGLPREIELRQKQYEYYRDLLLSFPKPEEVA